MAAVENLKQMANWIQAHPNHRYYGPEHLIIREVLPTIILSVQQNPRSPERLPTPPITQSESEYQPLGSLPSTPIISPRQDEHGLIPNDEVFWDLPDTQAQKQNSFASAERKEELTQTIMSLIETFLIEEFSVSSETLKCKVSDSKLLVSELQKHPEYNVKVSNDELYLGNGTFGEVKLVEFCKSLVAMKVVRSPMQVADLKQEFSILCTLRHPNIVQFIGADLSSKVPFLLTEYLSMGDLAYLIQQKKKRVRWDKHGRRVALQVAQGICYLHHRRIVHRDIKSPNIIIGSGMVAKVADVGLAAFKEKSNELRSFGIFSDFWASPEQRLNKKVSYPSDIFSFGVVLWELLASKLPFQVATKNQIEALYMNPYNLKSLESILPIAPDWPVDIQNLIRQCWEFQPSKRPTIQHCVDILSAFN